MTLGTRLVPPELNDLVYENLPVPWVIWSRAKSKVNLRALEDDKQVIPTTRFTRHVERVYGCPDMPRVEQTPRSFTRDAPAQALQPVPTLCCQSALLSAEDCQLLKAMVKVGFFLPLSGQQQAQTQLLKLKFGFEMSDSFSSPTYKLPPGVKGKATGDHVGAPVRRHGRPLSALGCYQGLSASQRSHQPPRAVLVSASL